GPPAGSRRAPGRTPGRAGGGGEVDDGAPGRDPGQDRVTDADPLVPEPEIAHEDDWTGGVRHRRTHPLTKQDPPARRVLSSTRGACSFLIFRTKWVASGAWCCILMWEVALASTRRFSRTRA